MCDFASAYADYGAKRAALDADYDAKLAALDADFKARRAPLDLVKPTGADAPTKGEGT